MQGVIYDFHGTLVDVTSLHHLLDERDYDGFYAGSLNCLPIESTVLAARHSHDAGYANLLLTGMPDRYTDGLTEWLARHDVPMTRIWMRSRQDEFKKSFVVKRRMYLEAVDAGYSVVRAYEDSPQDYDLWIRQGIPTELIPGYRLAAKRVDKPPAAS